MRKLILLSIVLSISFKMISQDSLKRLIRDSTVLKKEITKVDTAFLRICDESEPNYLIVDNNASFQSGDINDFRSWVVRNLVYPIEAKKAGIKGRVIVEFSVNSKGYIVCTKIRKGVSSELDNETIRCINSSPRWTPGKKDGKFVKQMFVIPIVYE